MHWLRLRQLERSWALVQRRRMTSFGVAKRIRRAEDGTIRLSMVEYHKNLKEIYVPKGRKSDPTAPLTAAEAKQLRALLGSFQWLVAQLRFDCSFLGFYTSR